MWSYFGVQIVTSDVYTISSISTTNRQDLLAPTKIWLSTEMHVPGHV